MIHLYLRSNSDQNNVPINKQWEIVREFAQQHNLDLHLSKRRVYKDTIKKNLYHIKSLAKRLRDGDTVIIPTISMVKQSARFMKLLDDIEEKNVRLIICKVGTHFIDTDTSVGKLLLSTIKEMLVGRGADNFAGSAPQKVITQAPIGYRWVKMNIGDEEITKAESMAETVDTVRKLWKSWKCKTIGNLVTKLNLTKVPLIIYFRKKEADHQWHETSGVCQWTPSAARSVMYGQRFGHSLKGYEEPEHRDMVKTLMPRIKMHIIEGVKDVY